MSACRICRAARKRQLRRQRGIADHKWSEINGGNKKCLRCEIWKPLSEFGRSKKGRGGRKGYCKECRREEYQLNREAQRKRDRAYYQANREEIITKVLEWQQAHRKERKAYLKQYRANNLERLLAFGAEYRKVNAEAHRHDAKQRRAKIRGAEGKHTIDDIRKQHKEQRGKCYWCGESLNGVWHIDHIVPISKGGGNGPGNICCACPPCNLSKADKMPWEFSDRLF